MSGSPSDIVIGIDGRAIALWRFATAVRSGSSAEDR